MKTAKIITLIYSSISILLLCGEPITDSLLMLIAYYVFVFSNIGVSILLYKAIKKRENIYNNKNSQHESYT